jgi:hypothetical protein
LGHPANVAELLHTHPVGNTPLVFVHVLGAADGDQVAAVVQALASVEIWAFSAASASA